MHNPSELRTLALYKNNKTIMENQTITTGTKVGYECPANEFKIGFVKEIQGEKALVKIVRPYSYSRWFNLSNLNVVIGW